MRLFLSSSIFGLLAILQLTSAAPTHSTISERVAPLWARKKWDVIVVGAGPAGIIVANRMSKAGKKTLLLEQGGPSYGITGGTERPDWLSGTNLSRVDVPGLYSSIFSDPGNLTCSKWANSFTGCSVGGSSAINAGLFFQPPASDFDNFMPHGWNYADVKDSIARVYANTPNDDVYSANKKFYLQSGYDAAYSWLVGPTKFTDVEVNAQANQKYNVFGRPEYDYSNGQRGGPVTTYLQKALKRPNFHLQIETHVKRVARNGTRATGVVAIVDGVEIHVNLTATGRVILSGGALLSPQLLMYSGIGDQTMESSLKEAGILDGVTDSWINNTAVGEGLFDNPNTFIEFSSPDVTAYNFNYTSPLPDDANLYLQSRSGPYSSAGQTSVFWSYINHTDGTPPTGVQGTIGVAGYSDYTNSSTITLNVYGTSGLLSKGKVVLDPINFLPGPNSNVYYTNPRDALDIAQFIHTIFSYLPSSTLTPLNLASNSTLDQIHSYIISPNNPYTRGEVQHWSSSCRIGSCVDVNAQVMGTENIHVVDASILPPLTVNPQFGSMIVGEKGAELILEIFQAERLDGQVEEKVEAEWMDADAAFILPGSYSHS